mmetsp:Transcript_29400/g.37911  ORF Transcript_29400/g.37911 Transcript_29400/m.37911 type:complete len:133 (-) Transcript_29400:41-439(-)
MSSFLCNKTMSKLFITNDEAESIFLSSGYQIDSIFSHIVSKQDHELFFHSLMGILIVRSAFNNKTSFVAEVRTRNKTVSAAGKTKQEEILSMIEIRSSVRKDGDIYFGIKIKLEEQKPVDDSFYYSLGLNLL